LNGSLGPRIKSLILSRYSLTLRSVFLWVVILFKLSLLTFDFGRSTATMPTAHKAELELKGRNTKSSGTTEGYLFISMDVYS
jgi:hypothetical protein